MKSENYEFVTERRISSLDGRVVAFWIEAEQRIYFKDGYCKGELLEDIATQEEALGALEYIVA